MKKLLFLFLIIICVLYGIDYRTRAWVIARDQNGTMDTLVIMYIPDSLNVDTLYFLRMYGNWGTVDTIICPEYMDVDSGDFEEINVENYVTADSFDGQHGVFDVHIESDSGNIDHFVINENSQFSDTLNTDGARFTTLKFPNKVPRPMVSFVFDDGYATDYTIMRPLFDAQNEVATSAIITRSVGTGSYMTWAQIESLDTDGWEIACHGGWNAATLTEAQLRDTFDYNDSVFTAQGFTVNNLVYPGKTHDELARQVASEYFRCARTANGYGLNPGYAYEPTAHVLRTYALADKGIDDHTQLATYKAYVDSAEARNLWLIMSLHETATADSDSVDALIDYIQAKSIPIVTLNQGLDSLENMIEVNDIFGVGITGDMRCGTIEMISDSASQSTAHIERARALLRVSGAEGRHVDTCDLRIGLDDSDRRMIICDEGDIEKDYGLSVAANPELLIYNAAGTASLKLSQPMIVADSGDFQHGVFDVDCTADSVDAQHGVFDVQVAADSIAAQHIVSINQVTADSVAGQHIVSVNQVTADSFAGQHIVSINQVTADSFAGQHIVSINQVSCDSLNAFHVVGNVHVSTDSVNTTHLVINADATVDSVDAQHIVADVSLVTGGTINLQTVTKTTDYTAASEVVILCDATSGDLTITLPTAVGITGRVYYIKRIDGSANTVTVDGNGTETIDDDLTKTLNQYDCMQIVSDGSEWWIL